MWSIRFGGVGAVVLTACQVSEAVRELRQPACTGQGVAHAVYVMTACSWSAPPNEGGGWFLAGFLRGAANRRRAASFPSTATRLDVRCLRVTRLPLEDQRRWGDRFRALDEFEAAPRQAAALGAHLVRGPRDALTEGVLPPL